MHSDQWEDITSRLDRIQASIAALSGDLRNTRLDLGLPLVHTPKVEPFSEMYEAPPAEAGSFSDMQAAAAARRGVTPVPVEMKPVGSTTDASPDHPYPGPYGSGGGGGYGETRSAGGTGTAPIAQSTEAERIKALP